MTKDINRVVLSGRLGVDPMYRIDADDRETAILSIATERVDESDTENRALCRGAKARLAKERLRKGDRVTVQGWLRTRRWEEDGRSHRLTEVVVEELEVEGARG